MITRDFCTLPLTISLKIDFRLHRYGSGLSLTA